MPPEHHKLEPQNRCVALTDTLDRRWIKKRGKRVHLTPTEFALVRYLMERAGQPVAHAELLRSKWGEKYENEVAYLRTFVRQIRLKLEHDPAQPRYLVTEPHFGYRFSVSVNHEFSGELACGTL